jgi:nucleoside-diphosphate-sugar epimerase
MKLFVTGGTGFVGSHFLRAALAQGHQVTALRRPGSQPRVPLEKEPVWVEGVLGSPQAEWFQGCECLVHLAAHSANVPYDSLEACLQHNVMDALRLLEAARQAGVGDFIIAGSCFEYGTSGLRYAGIPVDAPLEPTDTYPASKAAASVAFHAWAVKHRLRLRILRIFQVYGEGEAEGRFWPSLRKAALAGEDFPMTVGTQIRDFIEVGEVARQFVRALAMEGVEPGQPRVHHVATGQARTLRDFAEEWWKKWGARGKLLVGALPQRTGEIPRYVPDAASLLPP